MTHPANPLELTAGDLRLALRPDLGGCIAGLWLGELPVLRSTEPAARGTSRASGCYPLVPYSNRLGYRRFRWAGQDYGTQPNFDDSPHSVHGVAWQRAWQVESALAASATLVYRHEPDAHWPFGFRVRQTFDLGPEALRLGLVLENLSDRTQPVGLGWHPYFPRRSRSRLHAEASERWESDSTGLPTRRVPQAGVDGDVAHLAFDHCFEGWRGAARLRDERLSLQITSSLGYLVVFTPPLRDYYCVEPVSHVSNALHMADPLAHGLRSVEPGAATQAWMQLAIAKV